MDSGTQDQYIQKKLLYKFEKKIDLVQQEYLKQIFPSPSLPQKVAKQELLKQIANLEFMNFKYKAALLSSNTDLNHNDEEMLNLDSKILSTKDEIKTLQDQLQKAIIAKKNKKKFNEFGQELKKYDKKAAIDEKFQAIQNQIKDLDEKYEKEMSIYRTRERYLKASISALQCLFKDLEFSNKAENELTMFAHENKQLGEDDGQIE